MLRVKQDKGLVGRAAPVVLLRSAGTRANRGSRDLLAVRTGVVRRACSWMLKLYGSKALRAKGSLRRLAAVGGRKIRLYVICRGSDALICTLYITYKGV